MTNKHERVVIFCQAPSDIPFFLALYEKFKDSKTIVVYVINVYNNYKFIESLNLDLGGLFFIPYEYASLSKPWTLFKERKRISLLNAKHFLPLRNVTVYFCSCFEDWLTAYFVRSLAKNNNVYYLGNYDFIEGDYSERKSLNFRRFLLKSVYLFLTGINFKVEIVEKIPEFPYQKYRIEKADLKVDNSIFIRYGLKLSDSFNNKPVALFFVTPCQDNIFCEESYDINQLKLIELLKSRGWCIIVKGHPRLGTPENILGLVDMEIPQHIPAEFIQNDNISICLGIVTTAIVFIAKETNIPTYSLINLFEFVEPDLSDQFKDYLTGYSDNKVRYFSDLEQFNEVIANYDQRKD